MVMYPNISIPDINFSNISGGFIQWSTQGYVTVLGFMFLPIFYMGIIGYVYTRMESATAAVVAVLIIVSAMGNAFAGVPLLMSFLQILVALVMSVLVVFFLVKMRG